MLYFRKDATKMEGVKSETKRELDEKASDAEEEGHEEEDPSQEEAKLLQAFCNKLEADFRQPARALTVKEIAISYDAASIYGHRSGFAKGLFLTAPWIFHFIKQFVVEFVRLNLCCEPGT